MTEQSKDKITRIIKALLAKAAGTDNEAEADIFLAKAHDMMEQHQVQVSDILVDDPIDRSKPYAATSSSPSYKKHLWQSLARFYGCRTIVSWQSATEYEVHVLGRESARVTAELMYPFIMEQVRKAGRKIAAAEGMKNEACIRDVANALVIRLNKLYAEQMRNEPKPATVAGKNALIVTSALNQLVDKLYPKLRMAQGRGIGTSTAATAAAGGISLNRQMNNNGTKRLT